MNKKGFTLVELAIVLVIIGIILGGVIKGQDLVESAKAKRMYKQFLEVQVAYYTYIEKMNALPGDDSLSDPTNKGNGNGFIAGSWYSTTATDESRLFWRDLRAKAGFPGTGDALPQHVFNSHYGVDYSYHGLAKHLICFDNIKGTVAESIDRNYDDGKAGTGDIRVTSTATATFTPTSTYDICIALD